MMKRKRKKIANIIGARPNFVKVALVAKRLTENKGIESFIVDTGQHYDYNLSGLFLKELRIPRPRYNLGVGSALPGRQTATMLVGIERILRRERPDIAVVYGDTNSTLAGAMAAAKLGIRVAHVEAGLRSFNMRMPEEINRVMTDRISDICFCPTKAAVRNLRHEGRTSGVYFVGDVMYDSIKEHVKEVNKKDNLLCTIHRAENTDDPRRLRSIFSALGGLKYRIVMPLHPRTRKSINKYRISMAKNITLLKPVGYADMLCLEKEARLIITDSGGVQKEAFIFNVPCVTVREQSEWVETVKSGLNILAGTRREAIIKAVNTMIDTKKKIDAGRFYGDGRAHEKIADVIIKI